jgi:hypothetical protein
MTEIIPNRGEGALSLGRQSARAEALGLYRMLGQDGNTVEAIRELIVVPPLIERVLRAFAQAHPEETYSIDRNLKFRLSVAREFERLVREGVPVAELAEEEESELERGQASFASLDSGSGDSLLPKDDLKMRAARH